MFVFYVGWLFVVLWAMPRLSHRWFARGCYQRARFFYRIQATLRFKNQIKNRSRLSIVGCDLMLQKFERVKKTLTLFQHSDLDEESQAVFYNNSAYLKYSLKENLIEALGEVEKAILSRPGVPSFWHTKGLILEGLGKKNSALTCFQHVLKMPSKWLMRNLEAECRYRVGLIWHGQGHRGFGEKFFRQVCILSPESIWGEKAAKKLSTKSPSKGMTL